jgi:hypothetical protein
MRCKKLLVGLALSLAALPAFADQANLDRAVNDALATYRSGGENALATKANLCTTGVDFSGSVSSPAREVEYCMALEAAGVVMLQHDGKLAQSQYFQPVDVMVRAKANLARAHIVELPEQDPAYVVPRMKYVREQVLKRM